MQRQARTREDERHTGRRRPRDWRVYQQAEHCQGLSADSWERWRRPSSRVGGGHMASLRPSLCRQMLFHWAVPLLTPSFWTSSLQNGETIHLWCCKLPSLFGLFYFIYLFLAALVLGCCSEGFSSGGDWGLLSSRSGWVFCWSDFYCCAAWAIGVATQFLWPWGMWNLPSPGINPTSPALGITTGSPGKFQLVEF